MCASVLNQCQAYTFEPGSKNDPQYKFANEVITEYLQRVLPQIKKKQVELISEYAQDCVEDVKSCVQTNGYSDTDAAKRNTAIQACKTQIITCKSVTDEGSIVGVQDWVTELMKPDVDVSQETCVMLGASGTYATEEAAQTQLDACLASDKFVELTTGMRKEIRYSSNNKAYIACVMGTEAQAAAVADKLKTSGYITGCSSIGIRTPGPGKLD